MLSNLNNEAIFKKAFTNKIVFKAFVRDILGVEMDVNKIETNNPSVFNQLELLNIPHKFDLWAESDDKSAFVVIQRVTNDYNLGQFLYYCPILVQQLQKNINQQNIYVIVVKTDPYTISDKSGKVLSDEVLLYDMNPKTLKGEVRNLSNYQLVCINPNYQDSDTPKTLSDWLDFIYQSIQQMKRPVINLQNEGIRIASELINVNNITSDERILLEKETQDSKTNNESIINETLSDSKTEIAIKMLEFGMGSQVVAKLTGLNADYVRSLSYNSEPYFEISNIDSNKTTEDSNHLFEEVDTKENSTSFEFINNYEGQEEEHTIENIHTEIEEEETTKYDNDISGSATEDNDWSAFETSNDKTIETPAPASSYENIWDSIANNAETNSYTIEPKIIETPVAPIETKKGAIFGDDSVLIDQIINQIPVISISTDNHFRDPGEDKDSWIELYNYLTLSNMSGISSLVHDIAHDYKKSAEQRVGELKYLLQSVLNVKNYIFYQEVSVSTVDGIDVIINLMISYINRRVENIAKSLL